MTHLPDNRSRLLATLTTDWAELDHLTPADLEVLDELADAGEIDRLPVILPRSEGEPAGEARMVFRRALATGLATCRPLFAVGRESHPS